MSCAWVARSVGTRDVCISHGGRPYASVIQRYDGLSLRIDRSSARASADSGMRGRRRLESLAAFDRKEDVLVVTW
jgi:hypothetical protein